MEQTSSKTEKHRRWHRWQLWVMALCAVVFVVSGIMVLRDVTRSNRERRANEGLAEQVNAIKQTIHQQQQREQAGLPPAEEFEEILEPYDENGILIQYSALSQQNADLAGWLCIDGTGIDYPVMYAPDRKEYYLRRGFDRNYALSGSLFIAENCALDSNHLIIYGHRMKDGSMFGTLPSYADETYAAQHPVISFDTLRTEGYYELVGAFYGQVYTQGEEGGFRYYQYEDLSDPERFDEYVAQVKAASLYETGVEPRYGDALITLSTCDYYTRNGRFVVVARKMYK